MERDAINNGEVVETMSCGVVVAASLCIGLLDGSMYSNGDILINLQFVQDLDESVKTSLKWVLAGYFLFS